jgi:hypothetical protein
VVDIGIKLISLKLQKAQEEQLELMDWLGQQGLARLGLLG